VTTPGLAIRKVRLTKPGSTPLDLGRERLSLLYVTGGSPVIDSAPVVVDDLLATTDRTISIAHADPVELFVVAVPQNPGYSPVTD
jgi:hypothetical protein